MFQGGCLAEGESGEGDSKIVHVLVGGCYSDGTVVGKEVGDGCTKKVEAAKVAIDLCLENTCWFRFGGVAGC